jgi:hypothetical protein
MAEFGVFFQNYVYGMMLPDVSREIAAARRDENAANLLCALGLLCYTEILGRWVPGVKRGSRNAFETFFRRLGSSYADSLNSGEDPYRLYRNGLVHTFVPEASVVVAMLDSSDEPAPCGVVRDKDGFYHFVIERYFQDFVVAAARLHKEVVGSRHPLVHIYAPHLFPYAQGHPDVNPELA